MIPKCPQNRTAHSRRGAAVVAMVVAMLAVGLVMVGMVMAGARDQDLTIQRMNTLRSFYAAEGAVNMGIREVILNNDDDGDGGIGSISADGVAGNDPLLSSARAYVTVSSPSPGQVLLTSLGTAVDASRGISTMLSSASSNFGWGTPFAFEQQSVIGRQIGTKVTAPMTLTVLSISANVNGPQTKEARYAIYGDSLGEPGALLAQSAATAVGGNSAHFHWLTLPLQSTTITAADYWLALSFENMSMEYTFDSTGGQTRYNNNDAVANGYNTPWGVSTSSSTRRINIFATAASETTGIVNFSGAVDYDNSDPNAGGQFRDLTNPTRIVRGVDVSANAVKYNAINFTAAAGTLVADASTAYDIHPTTSAQTDFDGSLRVSADVLVSGVSYIGFGALVNETAGQQGIALALRENGNSDRLHVYRMPASADITGATALASTGNFNGIAPGSWYRLVMDVTVSGNNVTIDGRVYSHVTANNPNSSVNPTPLQTIQYSSTLAALSGLQDSGEVVIFFDATDVASRGSITNFRIDSSIGTTNSASVMSWTEQNPR